MSAQERLLTGWGRTAPTRAAVVRPTGVEAIRELLIRAPSRGVIARGLGRSYGDVAQNAGGTVIDMTSLADAPTIEGDTVTAGGGTSFDAILRQIVPRGWFLPVTPGTRFVTLGGAIANDVHGKNHHVDGSLGRHLVAFDLLTPDGELRRVTRTSEPRTWSSTVGGLGLTGVIVRAAIRLLPIESDHVRVDVERVRDIDELMARMSSGDQRYRYSVAWIDCLARGGTLGRGVLSRANHASRLELDDRSRSRPPAIRSWTLPPVPPGVPRLAGTASALAFNEAWFRRAPQQERTRIVPMNGFFYPLDAVPSWNRLYGRRGFVQHQLVVPFGSERAIVEVVERVATSRCPSFLGVLKRFGPAEGMLSFPTSGWTLALDFPAAGRALAELLDGIDRLVASVGGRVYLAKDSRLDPRLLPEMYPQLDRWSEARAALDPTHVMRSDIDRRLDLWSRARKPVAV